jgi:hypothetical protein
MQEMLYFTQFLTSRLIQIDSVYIFTTLFFKIWYLSSRCRALWQCKMSNHIIPVQCCYSFGHLGQLILSLLLFKCEICLSRYWICVRYFSRLQKILAGSIMYCYWTIWGLQILNDNSPLFCQHIFCSLSTNW